MIRGEGNMVGAKARHRGVALLTVLFILVLMTTLVVYLIEDEYLAVRRVENQRDSEQIYQMMAGNEQWAAKVVERDMKESQHDHLNEIWHELLPQTRIGEGVMQATVDDLQGRFNLNNMLSRGDPWYKMFQRLLQILDIDEGLADAVIDWVDADIDVSGNYGAEDAEYLLADPPYRTANRGFRSVGELVWVAGFDHEIVNKLSPYVVALPVSNTVINVNTASAPLLRALGPEILSEASAQVLIEGRGEEGYKDIDEFLVSSELVGQGEQISPLIDVSSTYFEVKATARYGRLVWSLYSMLQKDHSTQQVRVVQRRRGYS